LPSSIALDNFMLPTTRPPIEIGIIVAGPIDAVDHEAIVAAIDHLEKQLSGWLDRFDWRFQTVRRDEWPTESAAEPIDLLTRARDERDELGWDFAWVMTATELVSHYKSGCFAVVASALDAAVISTSRLDPRASDPTTKDDHRRTKLTDRVVHVALHTLGDWLGLAHHGDQGNVMHEIDSLDGLRSTAHFDELQLQQLRETLEAIADQRLEEQAEYRRSRTPIFYLRATWENKAEICDAVLHARPWEFPMRLSRLTTAAVSTALVLLMTAETWDMATSQTFASVAALFAFAMVATTSYVAVRQQLLLSRNGRRLTEQIVASNVSAVAIVGMGMLTMFALLSVLTLSAGWLIFPSAVVEGWAASIATPLTLRHYLLMAGTVGALGIIIGALGASFEQQHYFRHVIFVDEEI
jgi:hypothetical protein